MKYKILSAFGLIMATALIFSACTKSEIEKANDAYDWSKVQPMIFSFSGPTTGAASGLAAVKYSVAPRGGSTYTFETSGHGSTIEIDEDWPHIAWVTWDQSSVDVDAMITVYETTAAGLSSDKDTLNVALGAFCPKDFTDFVGTWVGTETGHSEIDPFTVTFVAGEGNTLVAEATAGTPAFLSKVFLGWGETFQAGHGNEGDINLEIDLLTGAVTIPNEYWGQTLPGPYDYRVHGGGSWSGCGSFTMEFDVFMDDSGWRSSHVVITKQ